MKLGNYSVGNTKCYVELDGEFQSKNHFQAKSTSIEHIFTHRISSKYKYSKKQDDNPH